MWTDITEVIYECKHLEMTKCTYNGLALVDN